MELHLAGVLLGGQEGDDDFSKIGNTPAICNDVVDYSLGLCHGVVVEHGVGDDLAGSDEVAQLKVRGVEIPDCPPEWLPAGYYG